MVGESSNTRKAGSSQHRANFTPGSVRFFQAKIAAAKDASAQSDLQAELDAYIDDNVYLLSNQWTVSPESLEEYHQVVQDQVVMWDDALNAREVELFQELCNNVYERTIPVDAIVTQLNRLYYFRTLEDS